MHTGPQPPRSVAAGLIGKSAPSLRASREPRTLGSSACRTAINHRDSPFFPRPASPPQEWSPRPSAVRPRTPSPRACSRGVPLPTTLRAEAPGGFPLGKTILAQSRRPYSLVPPSPCVPTTPEPLDCQAPQVSSRGEERARTSTPRPEPCKAPARVRPLGGLQALGVQAQGVGSPLLPPLTSHRPSPQVSERGATRAPRTGAGMTCPAREALLAEEEEAGEGRALCLPRVLPRLQLGPSPSPSRPPELWSDGAEEPRGRGRRLRDPGPPPPCPPAPHPPPRTAHPAPRDAQPLRSPRQPAPRRQGGELRQKVDLTRREPRWPGSRPTSAPPPRFARSPGESQAVVPGDKAQRPLSICSSSRLHEHVHPPSTEPAPPPRRNPRSAARAGSPSPGSPSGARRFVPALNAPGACRAMLCSSSLHRGPPGIVSA
ncbi:uncharacterized protein [Bos mutus]|uniref:uncharacterized protein n=1 Tax=Bos mutus TaxID=72004 RepID=UPI0038B55CB8